MVPVKWKVRVVEAGTKRTLLYNDACNQKLLQCHKFTLRVFDSNLLMKINLNKVVITIH